MNADDAPGIQVIGRPATELWDAGIMTSSIESQLEAYRRMKLRPLRVLAVHIEQVPHELGEPRQSICFELLDEHRSGKIAVKFTGVLDLKTDGRIHPGMLCRFDIVSVVSHQLEGSRFHVSNDEPQDFELRFYCFDFEIRQSPIGEVLA